MVALNALGGIFEFSEFSGLQDYLNFSVEETSSGELPRVNQERNIHISRDKGAQSSPFFATSAFPHMLIRRHQPCISWTISTAPLTKARAMQRA
jgi:hypothetical protein